jgi:WD40 repeat protein
VACLNATSFFAGHTDGVTRCFQLSTGDLQQTFAPPPGAAGARATEVTGIAVYGSNPPVLAVAHQDGVINNYKLQTGEFLLACATAPGLTGLLSLRRFNSLAAVHEGKNVLQVWDLDSDRSLMCDFTAELESIHRKTSKMTCARYDDARGVILAGSDDGTVYVRQVARIAGTKDLSVKLVRVCAPAATATGPSKVVCMWYETRHDLLLTGDLSGLCRRLDRVTGEAARRGAGAC